MASTVLASPTKEIPNATSPESSIDRLFNVVEISNGYIIVPHPHYQGERIPLGEAMFAETPQKLGEALALWVTRQILGRS